MVREEGVDRVELTWESMAQELLKSSYRPLMEILLRAAQQAAYG